MLECFELMGELALLDGLIIIAEIRLSIIQSILSPPHELLIKIVALVFFFLFFLTALLPATTL